MKIIDWIKEKLYSLKKQDNGTYLIYKEVDGKKEYLTLKYIMSENARYIPDWSHFKVHAITFKTPRELHRAAKRYHIRNYIVGSLSTNNSIFN